MGFYPINKAEITRVYEPERKIIARAFDEVLQKWVEEEFTWHQMYQALAWVENKLMLSSM